MFRRLLCGMLALLLAVLGPVQAFAEGIYTYPPVRVFTSSNLRAVLEAEFRQQVKRMTETYYEKYVDNTDGAWRYYYEAAGIKYSFDSEKGALWFEDPQADLAYNTNPDVSKRDYDKETREIMLYMLTQDVQNKILQMEDLTPEQRRSIFPGVMLDPTTGRWEISEQAVLAKEMADSDLQRQLDVGQAEAFVLFCDTGLDVFVGVYGGGSEETFDVVSLFTDAISDIWTNYINLVYEEERKALWNDFRQAMVDDLMAAQHNVDMQMYEGLYQLRSSLQGKSSRSEDEELMLECLNTVLDSVEKTLTMEQVCAKTHTANGYEETFEQTIEKIASDAVDELGMTEEALRSEQEILIEEIVFVLKTMITSLVSYASSKSDEASATLIELTVNATIDTCFEALLEASKSENMDTDGDGKLELEEILTAFRNNWTPEASEEVRDMLIELTEDIHISELRDQHAIKALYLEELTRKKDAMTKREFRSWENRSLRKKYRITTQQSNETRKKWLQEQEKKGFLLALVENSIKLTESCLDLYSSAQDMYDSGKDEVPISFVASAMYRARQTADSARTLIVEEYTYLRNQANVDVADLDELRDYVNAMYTVVSTDMLGHSYYITLCEWYEYQMDPQRYERNKQLAQELLDSKYAAAWEHSTGMGIAFTIFTPLYWVVCRRAAQIESMDSDYLLKVANESKYGSWLSLSDGMEIYNDMGWDLERFVLDERYDELFE